MRSAASAARDSAMREPTICVGASGSAGTTIVRAPDAAASNAKAAALSSSWVGIGTGAGLVRSIETTGGELALAMWASFRFLNGKAPPVHLGRARATCGTCCIVSVAARLATGAVMLIISSGTCSVEVLVLEWV